MNAINAALLQRPAAVAAMLILLFVAGPILLRVPRWLLTTLPAWHPNSRLGRLERAWARFRHWWNVTHRYGPELGGYVHDSSVTFYIPPTLGVGAVATWTPGAGQVADTIAVSCDATDEAATFTIPIMVPSSGHASRGHGCYLREIDVDFEVRTAALDAMSALVNKVTRGANGGDATVTPLTFTYDSGHDAANERITLDEHRMTLTLDEPIWVDEDEYILVELTFDKAATSLVDVYGAFARCTLRL